MFTASDVRLMISMSEFIAKVSSRVAREQEMLTKSKQPGSIPIGNEKIKYIRRAGLMYLLSDLLSSKNTSTLQFRTII